MIPGEKLTETKQENFKKHQLHTPPTPGTGRKGPLPKVGLCGRSRTMGLRWHSGLETRLAPGAARLHQSSRTRPSPAPSGRLLAWPGGQGRSRGGRRGLPGGWDLEFTSEWLCHPLKTLSGKIVTKCHDFHSSWSAEFWDSQHEFLSFSGSNKANATCLSTVPPSAVALRVRSVRKSGHNLV